MTTVEVFAPAKINLTLHITGQRDDGYHELDSLVVFADVGDTVHLASHTTQITDEGEVLRPGVPGQMSVAGPEREGVPEDASNLVLKALHYLDPHATPFIRLDKNLPAASGIGGGSSDAAAALRGLPIVLDCQGVTENEPNVFSDLAHGLGADIPMCLSPRPWRARGIGDRLYPVDLPSLYCVLVNPRIEVATGAVFGALANKAGTPMDWPPDLGTVSSFADWLKTQRNDLEPAALEIEPEIGRVLNRLMKQAGCLIARMSGSGATCFAIFETKDEATRAAEIVRWFEPNWWVREARLGDMSKQAEPQILR